MTDFDYNELRDAIAASSPDSAVYIGADSKVFSKNGVAMVAYVTVVILHHGSSKGAQIFRSHRTDRYYGQIRTRLMAEVTDAIMVGTEIADVIGDRGFEIHLDINPDTRYKSSEIVKEATGYVLGTLGFEPKIKPEAFAASCVADRWAVKDARKRQDSPAQKRKAIKNKKR